MKSTDTNLKIYISEEEREQLFKKMSHQNDYSDLLSAEHLETICLGKTHLADKAYGQIRRLLKQEYKQWLQQEYQQWVQGVDMTDKELAKEYAKNTEPVEGNYYLKKRYSEKQIEQTFLAGLKAERENEWHKVSEKLPEMDVLVYLWNKIDDFPVVARRHIPYGQKKWLWDCKWGSGFTISQLIGEDYLWKEIVLPEFPKEQI